MREAFAETDPRGLVGQCFEGIYERPVVLADSCARRATPALAIAHAIGRVGCFLFGDDYGVPSDLPWAEAFPKGLPPTTIPVHPT